MKKVFKLLLITILLLFSVNIKALTKNELIDEINVTFNTSNTSLNKFYEWSTDYSEGFINALKEMKEDDYKIDPSNHSENIDTIYSYLDGDAKLDFNNIKEDLIESLIDFETLYDDLNEYFSLQTNIDNGVPGSVTVFDALKDNLSLIKTNLKNVLEIYMNYYYDEINDKIDNYTTIDEILSIYDDLYETYENMDEFKKEIENKITNICKLYNDYYLDDYRETIKDMLNPLVEMIDEKFDTLYTKFETKLQTKLDNEITIIDNDCNELDQESIVEHNVKLINLTKLVDNNKNRIDKIFNDLTKNITVDRLSNKINTYKTKIMNRLNEADTYIRNHLLESSLLNVKNETDEKYFNINNDAKKVVFNGTETTENTFINKLESIGTLSVENDYNGKVGTGSIIKVELNNYTEEYVVVVEGDIKADGNVNISDVAKLAAYLLDQTELNELEEEAADVKDDNNINISDIAKLANYLLTH